MEDVTEVLHVTSIQKKDSLIILDIRYIHNLQNIVRRHCVKEMKRTGIKRVNPVRVNVKKIQKPSYYGGSGRCGLNYNHAYANSFCRSPLYFFTINVAWKEEVNSLNSRSGDRHQALISSERSAHCSKISAIVIYQKDTLSLALVHFSLQISPASPFVKSEVWLV